jgi:hypothetical protein
LLSSNSWRLAVDDETAELGPEVALISLPFALSSNGERLTGAGAGPDRKVVWPPRELECVVPASDSGEEMASCEGFKIVRLHLLDGAGVYFAGRD